MKKIISIMSILAYSISVFAQSPYILSGTNYTQNFDALNSGLPQGWRVDTLVNKNSGLGNNAISRFSPNIASWFGTTRGFKNVASGDGLLFSTTTTDQGLATDRALGFRQVSASGWDDMDSLISASFNISNTAGLNGFSLQFKLQSLDTNAKRINNWIVQYGLGANPTSFTTIATTPATLPIDSIFSNTNVSVNFGTALDNQSTPVWIRIMPNDTTLGSGSRPMVAIDDFSLSWSGTAVNNTPQFVSFNPANNATGVATSVTTLEVNFDKNISIGTGNITVKNLTDATDQTIPVSSASTNTMMATIPGVILVSGKTYAVQFDSTCFKSGIYNCLGIYDNITWSFMTMPAVLPPVTSLNETFTGCTNLAMGLFSQVSLNGNATWRCSTFGHNDANAAYINGGTATETFDNEDWLISPAINVSAMTNPNLQFWSKRRFVGAVTKEVFISNNYNGDPSTASWTNLNQTALNSLDSIWTNFPNTSLTTYKAAPFHIAFKYTSTATPTPNAEEWTIDDVSITEGPVSSQTIVMNNASFYVIGKTENQLKLALVSELNADYNYSIVDLMGNTIQSNSFKAMEGKNNISIELPSIANGIYMIQVWNTRTKGVSKFVKQ